MHHIILHSQKSAGLWYGGHTTKRSAKLGMTELGGPW